MPVILSQDHIDGWMNPKQRDPDQLKKLLLPFPSDCMKALRISTRINSTRNDDPSLIKRAGHA
jgi:putative SOS response-associated peptidase YedK